MENVIIFGAILYFLLTRKGKGENSEEQVPPERVPPVEYPQNWGVLFREGVDKAPDWGTLKRLWNTYKDKIPWLLDKIAVVAFIYTAWRAIEHELGVEEAKRRTREFEDRVLGPSWSKWDFETKKNMLYFYPGGLQKYLRLENIDVEGQYDYTLFPHRLAFRKLIQMFDDRYGTIQKEYPTVGSKEGWKVKGVHY